jgi:hypothetical protein
MGILRRVGIALAFLLCVARDIRAEESIKAEGGKKLQVVVIGIADYVMPEYQEDPDLPPELTLAGKVRTTCTAIREQFEKTYGTLANVRTLCTRETTTRDAIAHYFSSEFPRVAAGTLSVVFLISHGENNTLPASAAIRPDVRIITSDTTRENIDYKSISMTEELLPWLARPAGNAAVIAFVDTCHAGDFRNPRAFQVAELANRYGVHMNVMSSALPAEMSYSAAFTQAILEIWRGKDRLCMDDPGLAQRVRQIVQERVMLPLKTFEGLPTTLIRFQGPCCLDSLEPPENLLLLYSGAELPDTVYEIHKDDGASTKVYEGDLIGKNFEYVRLGSGRFRVLIHQREKPDRVAHVDLSDQRVQVLWLNDSPSPLEVGNGYAAAAIGAAAIGVRDPEVAALRQKAAAVYSGFDAREMSGRLLGEIKESGKEHPVVATVREAFESKTLSTVPLPRATVGRALLLNGRFSLAAKTLLDAAHTANDRAQAKSLATDAYYGFAAAGDLAQASKTRLQYGLDLPISEPGFEPSKLKVEEFRAKAAQRALDSATKSIMSEK